MPAAAPNARSRRISRTIAPGIAGQERSDPAGSGLVADRREQVAAAADGADHRGLGRIGFDLAPDSHDPQIDGAVEGFAVARVGQLQQALARQYALRICRENLE